MEVVSICPLRVASLRWQARRGRWALTVVAKATFRLAPVACTLAEEQEDANEHENHWDDGPRRSVCSPSDLVPFEAKAMVGIRPQEDQYETQADALLVVALGRLLRRAG